MTLLLLPLALGVAALRARLCGVLSALALACVVAAAPLDKAQYDAVQSVLAGLSCTDDPLCKGDQFAAADECPGNVWFQCDNGQVVKLVLGSAVTGSLNGSALGLLTGLTHLDMSEFHVASTIPTQVGRLSALTSLNLQSSAFFGAVPTHLNNLINLWFLSLRANLLTGSLPALDKLTKLRTLHCDDNVGLGGVMPALPVSLEDLSISNCSFTKLPPNLGALSALKVLQAFQNKLVGPMPVLPAGGTLAQCNLQLNNRLETNCIDCGDGTSSGPCNCVSNVLCAFATTSAASTPSPTPDSAVSTPAPTTGVPSPPRVYFQRRRLFLKLVFDEFNFMRFRTTLAQFIGAPETALTEFAPAQRGSVILFLEHEAATLNGGLYDDKYSMLPGNLDVVNVTLLPADFTVPPPSSAERTSVDPMPSTSTAATLVSLVFVSIAVTALFQ
jgi:hypothetical protein